MCKIKAKVHYVNVQNQGEKQEIETKVQNQRTHNIGTCTYDLREMNYISVLLLPLRNHMYVWGDKHPFGGLQACLYVQYKCTYDLRHMNYIAVLLPGFAIICMYVWYARSYYCSNFRMSYQYDKNNVSKCMLQYRYICRRIPTS